MEAGASGTALAFDGYFSKVTLPKAEAPRLTDKLSLEAWVVLGAYPWNDAGITAGEQLKAVQPCGLREKALVGSPCAGPASSQMPSCTSSTCGACVSTSFFSAAPRLPPRPGRIQVQAEARVALQHELRILPAAIAGLARNGDQGDLAFGNLPLDDLANSCSDTAVAPLGPESHRGCIRRRRLPAGDILPRTLLP